MSNNTFYIKRNDTSPGIQATLLDGANQPVSLTGASVRFHMNKADRTNVVDAIAQVVDENAGVVLYQWAINDTLENGEFRAEWEVTFSDGKVETFPNDEQDDIIIKIGRDLN